MFTPPTIGNGRLREGGAKVEIMAYETDNQTRSMVFRDLVEPTCSNCHFCVADTDNSSGLFFCTNPDTEAYLLGGMTPPIKQPQKWRCPLWQEKAVGDWS